MAYGFLTSPTLQLDKTSPGTRASCKSLVIFAIFVVVLSSILLFMDPPLNALESVDEVAVVAFEYMSILC
jgi:hypothetical protein